MKRRITLTTKLTITLTIINLVILGGFATISYVLFSSQNKQALEQRASQMADNLADFLAVPLWNYDTPLIDFLGETYLESEYISGLRIYSDLDEELFIQEENVSADDVRIIRDVYYANSEVPVGSLELILSGRYISEAQSSIIIFYVIAIFLVVFSSAFGTVLVMRDGLQKPLGRLSDGIRSIADGHYGIRLPEDRHVDVNQIITDVNGMASQIQERKRSLEQEITRRTAAETKLQNMNQELEERVAKRTKELQEVNMAQEESLRMLRETQAVLVESEKMAALGNLVAGLAHEINTPVGISVTAVTHLEEKLKELNNLYQAKKMRQKDFNDFLETAGDSTQMIVRNLRRASELIASFKQVAVDRTRGDSRTFNMREYLNDIILSLRPELKKLKPEIHIECDDEMKIYGNPGILSQIVTNFVVNSKVHGFGGFEGTPKIEITVYEQDSELHLIYADNGKGMSEDVRKHIFEPFFTTKRGSGGTGLGMNIVYNLITFKLKGSIICDSTPGEGTRFHLSFPNTEVWAGAVTEEQETTEK
ncbi:MAG: sensor histidine kinase [Spirochaetia bacterium]